MNFRLTILALSAVFAATSASAIVVESMFQLRQRD